MARTRKIDKIDELILGVMSGEIVDTNVNVYWRDKDKEAGQRNYNVNSGSVEQIAEAVNRAAGCAMCHNRNLWDYKLPTLRYHIGKLKDMGYLRQSGVSGWGRSYSYTVVTDEQKLERETQKRKNVFRKEFEQDMKEMLSSVGVTFNEYPIINLHGFIEVKASDLARILKENYSFENEEQLA